VRFGGVGNANVSSYWAVACACVVALLLVAVLYWVGTRNRGRGDGETPPETAAKTAVGETVDNETADGADGTVGPQGALERAVLVVEALDSAVPMGIVRSVLRPRGLVEVNGLIEPGWWEGDDPAPARDSVVQVIRSSDGTAWIVRSLTNREGHSPGRITAVGSSSNDVRS
jgi:hypothetical protein